MGFPMVKLKLPQGATFCPYCIVGYPTRDLGRISGRPTVVNPEWKGVAVGCGNCAPRLSGGIPRRALAIASRANPTGAGAGTIRLFGGAR